MGFWKLFVLFYLLVGAIKLHEVLVKDDQTPYEYFGPNWPIGVTFAVLIGPIMYVSGFVQGMIDRFKRED